MSRPPSSEPDVVGHPELVLTDEEREILSEMLVELLLEALGPAAPKAAQ